MSDPRIIICPDCGGEGFLEYGHPNAPWPNSVNVCPTCDGAKDIEVDTEPVGFDDLDEMEGTP